MHHKARQSYKSSRLALTAGSQAPTRPSGLYTERHQNAALLDRTLLAMCSAVTHPYDQDTE